ncbi:MAG: hypothetical protein ACKVWV_18980 [Planctomycetota bacterium]
MSRASHVPGAALLFGVLAACASSARAPKTQQAPLEVEASTALDPGARLSLDRAAYDPARLSARVDELVAAGRSAQAERLVRRYPDVACAALGAPANDAAGLRAVFERTQHGARVCALSSESLVGTAAWRTAVEAAAPRTDPALGWCEPAFWERALAERPVNEAWPASVHEQLARAANVHLDAGLDDPASSIAAETAGWVVIGAQRTQRAELEAALMAHSRALGTALDVHVRACIEIEQAACLARLDRKDAARTILLRWCDHADARIARAALAWLGLLEVELERAHEARRLLERALALALDNPWTQRARCEANLGLALLLLGEESEGLRVLHAAQARFEADGRFEDAARALRNEVAYFTSAGEAARSAEARARLAVVERR